MHSGGTASGGNNVWSLTINTSDSTSFGVGYYSVPVRIEADEQRGLTLQEARQRCMCGWMELGRQVDVGLQVVRSARDVIRIRIRDMLGSRGIGCLNFRRASGW